MASESPEFFLRHSRVRDIFHGYPLGDLISIRRGLENYRNHPEYPAVIRKIEAAIDAEMGNFGFVFARRDKEAEDDLGNGQVYVNTQALRAWLGKPS